MNPGAMVYHASNVRGITVLEPRISNHHRPLIYFSKKRENVLVYLSNAVEKYCREKGFPYTGVWQKWASYGFDPDGVQRIEEYYPNALEETYRGVSGLIYRAETVEDCGFQAQIPDAVTSEKPVPVSGCEYVEDAYEAILLAERQGLVRIVRYPDQPEAMRAWLARTIPREYENAEDHPEYRFFLEEKFGEMLPQTAQTPNRVQRNC